MNLTPFRRLLQQEPIDVAHAALQFAQTIAFPDLDIAESLNDIVRLANGARESEHIAYSRQVDPAQLAKHLYHVEKLHGDSSTYHDPENSFLNTVLKRRLGIPISLSVLYIAVARQLGLDAFGVGLPGHFVVGVKQAENTTYLDPFHGKAVTKAACANLVRATTGYKGRFRDEWLNPMAHRDILLRMLNNLRIVYMHQQTWERAQKVLLHIDVIRPNSAETKRDLGLIAYALHDYASASHHLDTYLSQNPQAKDAPILKRTIGSKLAQWAKQN